MRFDHVALATRAARPALDVLVGDLGGTVISGGLAIGYRPMQVYLGDANEGMKVELLEVWRAEDNDFLARFLDRHGDGPHHLTFKVDDLPAALERVETAGITPVGVDMSSEIWREAFLQPRDAAGTVVQLASSSMPYKSPIEEYAAVRDGRFLGDDLESGEPWWGRPPPRAATPTYFRRVVMATPSIEDASKLFVGLLDGTRAREGDGWLDLVWPGGGCIRLEEHSDRAAGVDRLELEGPGAPREQAVAGARLVVNPAA